MKGRKLLGNQKKCDYYGDGFKELNQKGRAFLKPVSHRIIRRRLKADIAREVI